MELNSLNILAAVKDNVLSLSSLLALVNERVLHTFDELKEVNVLSKEQTKQYNEVISMLNSMVASLNLLGKSVDDQRRDADKQDQQIEKIHEKLDGIKRDVREKVFSELSSLTSNMKSFGKNLLSFKADIFPNGINNENKKMQTSTKWIITVSSLIGSVGFWELLKTVVSKF